MKATRDASIAISQIAPVGEFLNPAKNRPGTCLLAEAVGTTAARIGNGGEPLDDVFPGQANSRWTMASKRVGSGPGLRTVLDGGQDTHLPRFEHTNLLRGSAEQIVGHGMRRPSYHHDHVDALLCE